MRNAEPARRARRVVRILALGAGVLAGAHALAQGAPAGAPPWPHNFSGPAGTAVVYQPQVVSWPEHRTLNARVAVGITPAAAKAPVLGTIDVAFTTETDLASRTVLLTEPRLTAARFPSAEPAQAQRFDERIRVALAAMGPKRYPLDTVLMSLPAEKPPEVPLKNDPPRIFVATAPASLVVFDGEPVLAPVSGTSLSFAVNTNWDVFFESGSRSWYLLVNGGWLTAPAVEGPWRPVATLPPEFAALPADASFADVKKQIPARPMAAGDVPAIDVSTAPAEIIVTTGPPTYAPIPGTSLQYLSNSDAVVFREIANLRYFYLVSGRWFSAPALTGPWTYATPSLPADFARIPADGPRGFVRVSVPGTPEAEQALREAQVPQQASLDRNTATLTVVYAGAPKFEPIAGTSLSYAVNTSFDVIRAGDAYYACYQGAWFVAPAPNGPWTLATSVPVEIDTIPASSPLYRVTYVKVYAVTPTYVTYGYTSGYTLGYVSAGVVVYGTGWYYPPVIVPGPVPIYYPYPYSYSGAVYYNPATGAWARGGAIYGPYGGVVKGGTAYNPATGAWAHGGAVYGPYGGAGAFSAYNPSTGSYVHGGAVWGPDGASGSASWYNARTGISGTTQQNANAYGRWGSSTINTPTQTINTQSRSNAQGSAGAFSSSSGAKGAGVKGAGGNSAGAVKTAGGNVYAGADGNVYKKTDSGWEKYDNGSWNSVQPPSTQRSGASSQNLSGAAAGQNRTQQRTSAPGTSATSGAGSRPFDRGGSEGSAAYDRRASGQPAGASRFEGSDQLERDRQARTAGAERWAGAQREGQWGAQREGRSGGGARDVGGRGGGLRR